MVAKAAEIALHLQSGRPFLESKHRLPIKPEVGIPEGSRKNVTDFLILQILLFGHEKFSESKRRLLIQLKLPVRMCIFSAVHRGTAKRIVRVMLVQPIILVQYGNIRRLNGRHILVHIPHTLEVVIHLSSATHIKAFCHILSSVTAASGKFQLLQKMNALSLYLPVPHEIKCCGKPRKACSDNICRLPVRTFRLLRFCKCFIISRSVIHGSSPLSLFNNDFPALLL